MGRESFEGQTGGARIDDFDFVVTDAWFGSSEALNEASGEEIMLLHLVGTTNLEDYPVLDEVGFHPSFKLKEGWEVRDGGATVEYTGSGKDNFGSWYGRFCDIAIKVTEDIAEKPEDPLAGDAEPIFAKTWIGTKWHMLEQEYDFGTFGVHAHLLPTAFLGKADTASAPSPAADTTAANNGSLRDQLLELAKGITTEEFQPQALVMPGVNNDSELLMEIASGTLHAEANA